MSLLEVDSILSQEERLPCTFVSDARNLGHLDNGTNTDNLSAETRIDLPLWLARNFKKKEMVEIEFPKHYGQKMRHEMGAGAEKLKLRDYSYYFFDVGLQLIEMEVGASTETRTDLRDRLRGAFLGQRYHKLTMNALSQGVGDDVAEYTQSLTSSELTLFNQGYAASKDLYVWRGVDSGLLKKASVLGRRNASSILNHDQEKRTRI